MKVSNSTSGSSPVTKFLKLRNNAGENFCYANVIVQMLDLLPLKNFILILCEENKDKISIYQELKRLYTSGTSIECGQQLSKLVAQKSNTSYFNDRSQQDAEEFFTTLITLLEIELNNHPVFNTFSGIEKEEKKFDINEMGNCNKCKLYPLTNNNPFFL